MASLLTKIRAKEKKKIERHMVDSRVGSICSG